MATKLSDGQVKAAKPAEKRYVLADSGGLYLEVSPGGGKWRRFRYRENGARKVISFGTYPEVSLKSARQKRDLARTLLAEGKDPKSLRESEKPEQAAPTFGSVAEEWFSVKSKSWTSGHAKTVRLRMEKYLLPSLSRRAIAELATKDFLKFRALLRFAKNMRVSTI